MPYEKCERGKWPPISEVECLCADVKSYGGDADTEYARLQARDLLQHMWTGPISNAPVDIVQGHRSVEVRPVGTSKVRDKAPFWEVGVWNADVSNKVINMCLPKDGEACF